MYHISPSLSRPKGGIFLNKLKPKPLDIINAAIAEIYGEQAVELLTMFSTLNDVGKSRIMRFADDYKEIPEYTKVIKLCYGRVEPKRQ